MQHEGATVAKGNSSFGLEWWKLATEKSSQAVAFVGTDDRFDYTNLAWCRLVGWSASQLKQKRWQDITDMDSIAGDEAEHARVKNGKATEYYMEKVYLKPDGERVPVAEYGHRFPPDLAIQHQGYIVFATRLTHNHELDDLRARFAAIERIVRETESKSAQIHDVKAQAIANRKLIEALVAKADVRMGDYIGGDKTGHDKITGDPRVIGGVAVALIFALIWIVYYLFGGTTPPPNMPNVEPQRYETPDERDAIIRELLKRNE